jgi:hypothetical protein
VEATQQEPTTAQDDGRRNREMGGKVSDSTGVLPMQCQDVIRGGNPYDLNGIGETKTDQSLGKAPGAPADDNQCREDERDDGYAYKLESKERARATRDQAEKDPNNAPDGHGGITPIDR